MLGKKILFWVLAVVLTLAAAVFQRKTGPTYPKSLELNIEDQFVEFELLRSADTDNPCTFDIEIEDEAIDGYVVYRRYPTNEEWTRKKMKRVGKKQVVELPSQPAAGKLIYYVEFEKTGKIIKSWKEEPVIIRFKGAVPSTVLLIHVLGMFLGMLLASVSGLFALGRIPSYKRYAFITIVLLTIGGMIFGPIVQKHAFGEYWTGVPNGWDLTDNKTLIAYIGFLIAWLGNIKKERPYLTIIATILLLVIFSIPHSMFGSELDYSSGEVTQGLIFFVTFGSFSQKTDRTINQNF